MGVYCSALEKLALPDRVRRAPAKRAPVATPAQKVAPVPECDSVDSALSHLNACDRLEAESRVGLVQAELEGVAPDVPVVPANGARLRHGPDDESPTLQLELNKPSAPRVLVFEGAGIIEYIDNLPSNKLSRSSRTQGGLCP